MKKRGPKSAAELAAVVVDGGFAKRPDPPEELTEEQAQIWRDVVASEPPGHFGTAALSALLVDYCQHRDAARNISAIISSFKPEWLKADEGAKRYHALLRMRDLETRASLSCATKLRITNQSRYTPQAAGTAQRGVAKTKKPWEA